MANIGELPAHITPQHGRTACRVSAPSDGGVIGSRRSGPTDQRRLQHVVERSHGGIASLVCCHFVRDVHQELHILFGDQHGGECEPSPICEAFCTSSGLLSGVTEFPFLMSLRSGHHMASCASRALMNTCRARSGAGASNLNLPLPGSPSLQPLSNANRSSVGVVTAPPDPSIGGQGRPQQWPVQGRRPCALGRLRIGSATLVGWPLPETSASIWTDNRAPWIGLALVRPAATGR